MKILAQRYQRAYRPLVILLIALMLGSILWNDFTWPTTVIIALLVVAILLSIPAGRIASRQPRI